MPFPDALTESMAARLSLIKEHLDERAWRLLLGAEAKTLGRGGIKAVAQATGAHPDTVAQGVRELDYEVPIPGRIRRPGAGRPALASTAPALIAALDAWSIPSPVATRSLPCGGRRDRPPRWRRS